MEESDKNIFKPEEPETKIDRYLHLVKSSEAKDAVRKFFEYEEEIRNDPRPEINLEHLLQLQRGRVEVLRREGEKKIAGDLEKRIGVSPNELD